MHPDDPSSPSFADLGLPAALLQVLGELGYTLPTPIQAQTVPPLLAGRDLVGHSPTGSGKTLAFALPILAGILVPRRRVQALVLCPTRELAAQVATTIRTAGRHIPGLRVLVLGGGVPSGPQRQALEEGVHVVVGTPGRVRDHLDRGSLDAFHLQTVVLDEADRMLDMGFQEDVEHILGGLPSPRQSVFFSATWPPTVAAMSDAWQQDPAHVTIAEEASRLPDLRQVACVVDAEDKEMALRTLICAGLAGPSLASALVFCNHKVSVSALTDALEDAGVAVGCLHGDLEQRERDRVMAKLRNGSVRVLVATDVAARGLDVDGLDLVVNVEIPASAIVYVHRVGRTGRAGKRGIAVSFVTSRERTKLERIEAFTGVAIESLSLGDLVAEWRPAQPSAGAPPASGSAPAGAAPVGAAAMETLFIGGGRKDKLRPGDILGALTGEAGFVAADIGRIEIHDRFAYVAVSRTIADAAHERLSTGRIKGRHFRVERVR